jgi:UDP-2-acetamido-3-amino-2,3-dideoxy-glucuronate N-acetyltransferase
VVDDPVKIGKGTKIWHFSHVQSNAQIGENTILGQNVNVASHVKIGSRVKIQNNVSIYDNVYLEEGVFCGPSIVFTNVYNPRSLIERKDEYKDTFIKKGATLGANCTIICGVTIGEFAFVGAGAVVNQNVPPYALVAGVPARQIGWMSEYGEKLDLPLSGNVKTICKSTGKQYQLKDHKVSVVS